MVKIVFLRRKSLILCAAVIIILLLGAVSLIANFAISPVNKLSETDSRVVVIDPGHGGIDGGTNKGGIIEKEINLDIGKKIKALLEQKGYEVIMTREEDVSLEYLDNSVKGRHQRDLQARANIINNSNARLFLSIHVNCNLKKPATNGAIVFYNDKYGQNKSLAYCVQRALNDMETNKNRSIHNPVAAKYFILDKTNVPGILVETAFISNKEERREMEKDMFRQEIAEAIITGVEGYINESDNK